MTLLSLENKNILLGVTGSIAAYKSAELVRRLRQVGAQVRVAMTENAKQFITPLTMQAVSGFPIQDDLFDLRAEAAMGHIELARWADIVLIAPATADFMARLAQGEADDLLTTLCLATTAPIALAPAMNQGMWKAISTQANFLALQKNGVMVLGPDEGSQACGDVGLGRMLEPLDIIQKMNSIFATGLLAGNKILITAGPTQEAIDPIRYITNGSSGKMGYALAEAASEAGAKVTLISGPVQLQRPPRVDYVSVVTAQEMYELVMNEISYHDIFLSVAAVGDYRCQIIATQKIHKHAETLQLVLERNPDIVESVGQLSPKPFIVGFAAETEDVIEQAKAKCQRKKMDMIIANRVGLNIGSEIGMGSDENEVTVIFPDRIVPFPAMSKRKLARLLIPLIAKEYKLRKQY